MAKRMRSWLILGIIAVGIVGEASAQFKYFDSNGVQIRYLEQGTGEPVVLIHGNTSRIELNWVDTGVFDALAAKHRVIALDVRGYGESGKPHDPSAYGAEMGLDVVRLLDRLSIERAHIVGYSMGARLTSWLVVNRPERILTATLGASTYSVDSPERREGWEATAQAWVAGRAMDAASMKRGNPGIGDAEAAAFVARHTSINDPLAVAAVSRARAGFMIREEALSATNVPVLHVYGSLETPTRLREAERLRTLLPSVESVVLENATHSGHTALYRHPEFVGVIENFIEKHRTMP